MKLCLGLVALCLGTSLLMGCGPGLGHHGAYAKAPVGTTELTSADDFQLPSDRGSLSQAGSHMQPAPLFLDPWEEAPEAADPKLQTWGEPQKPEDRYGF